MRFDEHGHVLITPRQLHEMAFEKPDHLINHWLMPGTPWAFATSEKYCQFVDYLSERTGIHPRIDREARSVTSWTRYTFRRSPPLTPSFMSFLTTWVRDDEN